MSLISKAVRVASVPAKRDSPTPQAMQKHMNELKVFTEDNIKEEDEDSFALAEKQAEHFASNHVVPIRQFEPDDISVEHHNKENLTAVEEVTDMFEGTGKL